MSAGKPVVSYDYEEVRKIVRDAGLLAEVGNRDDFIDKLAYLVENEAVKKALGNNGRKIAVKEYDWKKRAKDIERIYDDVL